MRQSKRILRVAAPVLVLLSFHILSPEARGQQNSGAINPTQQACLNARDASYHLRLENSSYTVRKLSSSSGVEVPAFFDSANRPVTDPTLTHRLATAAWTLENVTLDPGYRLRKRSDEVAGLLETARDLKKYEVAQDELVRVSVELFAGVVSGGVSQGGALGRVVRDEINAQLKDPKNYLLALTYGSLLRSKTEFQQMESVAPEVRSGTYDVVRLEQSLRLYREASGLLQTFRPVAVALMPQHWNQLVDQALSTTGSAVLSVLLQNVAEAFDPAKFVDALLSNVGLIKSTDETSKGLQTMAQNAKFARDYSAAIDRLLDRWTTQGMQACAIGGSTGTQTTGNQASLTGTTFSESSWTTLKMGQSSGNFAFAEDGTLSYRGKVLYRLPTDADRTAASIRFTPASPLNQYITVLRWDEDYGGMGGLMVGATSGNVEVPSVSPARWRVIPWVSWSPDGQFALLAASGEVTMGDMVLVNGRTRDIREIHFSDFTHDHGKTELQVADLKSLEWLSPSRFRLNIAVHCNSFEVNGCDFSRISSTHMAEVELPSLRMQYSSTQSQNAAITPAVRLRRIYIPSHQGAGLIEIDPETRLQSVAKTSLFNNSSVIYSGSNNEFYVTALNGDAVSVLKADPLREVATINGDIGWNTLSMALRADGTRLYLACQNGRALPGTRLVVLDLHTRKSTLSVPLTRDSNLGVQLALSPDDSHLYASWGENLDVYDSNTLQLLKRKTIHGWNTSRIAVSGNGKYLYLVQNATLQRVRAEEGLVDSTLALPEYADFLLEPARNGNGIWLSGAQRLYRVSTMKQYEPFELPQDVPRSRRHYLFSQAADGNTLYVLPDSDARGETLSLVDVSTKRVVGTVPDIDFPASVYVPSTKVGTTDTTRNAATVSPTSNSLLQSGHSGLWIGKLTAARWTQPVKLALEIEGNKLHGYIDSGCLTGAGEFVGNMMADDFTLRDDCGNEWRGRFISEKQITGVRPNDSEGKILVPFQLTWEREILPTDFPSAPPTTSDWSTFLTRLSLAVQQKQLATLGSFMSVHFYAENYPAVPHEVLVKQLNLDQIARVLRVGKWQSRTSSIGHNIRMVVDSKPCPTCKYEVALAFEQDRDEQWHWTQLSYPGD